MALYCCICYTVNKCLQSLRKSTYCINFWLFRVTLHACTHCTVFIESLENSRNYDLLAKLQWTLRECVPRFSTLFLSWLNSQCHSHRGVTLLYIGMRQGHHRVRLRSVLYLTTPQSQTTHFFYQLHGRQETVLYGIVRTLQCQTKHIEGLMSLLNGQSSKQVSWVNLPNYKQYSIMKIIQVKTYPQSQNCVLRSAQCSVLHSARSTN